MAEQIGGLYPTQIPSLSEAADIQEALRLYHYGRPSGTGTGQYDPTNTNLANLNPTGTTPSVAWYLSDLQSQITTISGTVGVQAATWNAKGAIVTATSAANLVALSVGSNGQVLTADSTTASGLRWASPEVTLSNAGSFSNKNISMGTNSISGTVSQFNAALLEADFITTVDIGTVTNTMLAGSIADSKLSTISTAGKVSNSATTAASANTANAIVARDASGNFIAGTITATGVIGRTTVNSGATANVGRIFVHNPTGGNPTGAVAGDIWIW
jgi:hypothetical protein